MVCSVPLSRTAKIRYERDEPSPRLLKSRMEEAPPQPAQPPPFSQKQQREILEDHGVGLRVYATSQAKHGHVGHEPVKKYGPTVQSGKVPASRLESNNRRDTPRENPAGSGEKDFGFQFPGL